MAHVPSPQLVGRETPHRIAQSALNEYELAARWGVSVKTMRRWRQQQLGPIFCKVGARVIYLISDVEDYERRVARCSTSARAYA